MTIDEAIKHCLEVAENNEQFASGKWIGSEGEANRQECEQCAADHRQLAEWLRDLKEAKRLLKLAILDIYHKCSCENFDCDICVKTECDYDDRFIWRYKDEVFKIIDKE